MFYPQVFWIVWNNGRKASRGKYGYKEWADSSFDVFQVLERVGMRLEITGMKNLSAVHGPIVVIGNHMSTLETLVLPGIVQPVRDTTFVVKKSLMEMPVFGPVMRSRDPVVVERKNPREDLRTVLQEGLKRIQAGISVIIFPQSTRSAVFNPEDFNSLGIKLALKAGVPVVPVALKTDAWGNGRYLKEFGPLDINKKVHFAFGEPMTIKGRGAEEHQQIVHFIQTNLDEWKRGDVP
jgi:1-acyl-sn-glycerol-3-phosphate acyltransferase